MPNFYCDALLLSSILALLASPSSTLGTPGGVTPATADAFANSVGVDTHFSYPATPYTDRFATIAADLIASGIRHIRDGGPGFTRPQALTYLGQRGVSHSLGFATDTTGEQIVATLRANAPYVDFVEPQNELDLHRDHPNWVAEWRDEQRLLYTTVRSDPSDAEITVVGPAPGHLNDAAALGAIDQYEDIGSMHYYPCAFNPGDARSNISLPTLMKLIRLVHTVKPIWTTEIGYEDDLPQARCALADSVIAKYDPRTLAEHWLAGQTRTYFYQFADMGDVRGYDSMGLVTANGDPKPQYKAIQSMQHLLSDPGPPFEPTPLAYSLSGETENVHQLLVQKRDKTYFIMLWLEVPSWDAKTRMPLRVPVQKVTLVLPTPPTETQQFVYSTDWGLQGSSLPSSRAIDVRVSDSISFIRVRQ